MSGHGARSLRGLPAILAALLTIPALSVAHADDAADAGQRPRLLVLCVDGLRADVFERLLAEGRLPAIERLVKGRASTLGRALASFPSSTAPSVPEFLTGRYADRTTSMPRAIHAFDRSSGSARRYSLEPAAWDDGTPTLFTLLDSRGETSYSLFEGRFESSVSFSSKRELVWGGILEALHLPVYNPDRSLLRQFRRMVEVRGMPPRAAFLMFNSVDLAGHLRSPESKRYEDALVHLDRLLESELLDWMKRYPLPGGGSYLDDTTIAIFGDHGMESSRRFVDLPGVLKRQGLKVVDMGTVFQVAVREKLSRKWAARPDVVLAPGGSNVTQVYLRRAGETWATGPASGSETESIARQLAAVPGVEFVVRRLAGDRLELRAEGKRRAVLVEDGDGGSRTFAYLVGPGPGEDPLGYLADPAASRLVQVVDGSLDGPVDPIAFHGFDEWHLASEATTYPAAVPLILKGCASGPTQGDLVLTSAPGWSFLRHSQGDHGGLRQDSIETALLLSGPRVRAGASLAGSRLIDLLPTFLDLLGLVADPDYLASLDGRPLPVVRSGEPVRGFIPPLRAAGPAARDTAIAARRAGP
ncbi:MAG: alkaline phosphatase family protein [Acidobacteriia bacterium]|nr:alkaline phosphatase family protein [Terriglobia bacterium]